MFYSLEDSRSECEDPHLLSARPGAPFGEVFVADRLRTRHFAESACGDETQNRSAGGQLARWYGLEHVLAMDQFYVQIDP
jgi:hypothetical protein